VVEEGSKAAVLLAIYRWRRVEFDGVLDGIVYAAMVGLGFAFTENVLYYGRTALEGGVPLASTFFVRGVLAPFAHPVFTALTGVGLGLAALRPGLWPRLLPGVGLLGAMSLHRIWNTAAGVGGGLGFLTVYVVVMVPVFLALVAVAVGALFRERRVLREYLQPELASGLLTRDDLTVFSSLGGRRRALRAASARAPRRGATAGTSITWRPSSPSCVATSRGGPNAVARISSSARPSIRSGCASYGRRWRRARRQRRRRARCARARPRCPPPGTPTPTVWRGCGGGTGGGGPSTPPPDHHTAPTTTPAARPPSSGTPAATQTGRSVVSPQLRQNTSEVSDMRAIIEWAPQLGQSERSS
jgi:PrsW family intramembrane metalloprotease